jgi:CDP-ribitol ribitolphosphotransferase
VLFKMHPFVIEPLEIPAELTDRLIDASAYTEFNELLFISDLVVTDYSSLVFEYSTLGRPMLFFVYDLEEYVATRDFYQDITELAPGKLVRTFEELLAAIRAGDFEQHKVEAFAATHFDHRDAGSSDRVIDEIILG